MWGRKRIGNPFKFDAGSAVNSFLGYSSSLCVVVVDANFLYRTQSAIISAEDIFAFWFPFRCQTSHISLSIYVEYGIISVLDRVIKMICIKVVIRKDVAGHREVILELLLLPFVHQQHFTFLWSGLANVEINFIWLRKVLPLIRFHLSDLLDMKQLVRSEKSHFNDHDAEAFRCWSTTTTKAAKKCDMY